MTFHIFFALFYAFGLIFLPIYFALALHAIDSTFFWWPSLAFVLRLFISLLNVLTCNGDFVCVRLCQFSQQHLAMITIFCSLFCSELSTFSKVAWCLTTKSRSSIWVCRDIFEKNIWIRNGEYLKENRMANIFVYFFLLPSSLSVLMIIRVVIVMTMTMTTTIIMCHIKLKLNRK